MTRRGRTCGIPKVPFEEIRLVDTVGEDAAKTKYHDSRHAMQQKEETMFSPGSIKSKPPSVAEMDWQSTRTARRS